MALVTRFWIICCNRTLSPQTGRGVSALIWSSIPFWSASLRQAAQTAAAHPLTRCLQIFHPSGRKRLSVRVAAAAMKLFHSCSSFLSGYSTHFRNKPFAGRVGPARLRSRLARMAGMSAARSRPAPTSHKVPASMRTQRIRFSFSC